MCFKTCFSARKMAFCFAMRLWLALHWNGSSALCEFLRIDLSPQIANWVSKEMCTNDLVEDVSRHKRQVFPGDFRRKLTASMQDQLTSMLRPHLDAFGYS